MKLEYIWHPGRDYLYTVKHRSDGLYPASHQNYDPNTI